MSQPPTTKMVDGTNNSAQNLSKTIHSLLGLKTHLNSNWVTSVCDILHNLRSSSDLEEPQKPEARNHLAEEDDSAITKLKDEFAVLKNQIHDLNSQRKKVLNDYLDLKGNIRVFCRIRPPIIINTGENHETSRSVRAMDSSKVVLEVAGSTSTSRSYNFDRVFQPSSTQDDVFKELEPIIRSALDGYNACILAYGQTGTGKTFTMEGNPKNPGVVPRTIQALFKQASDNNNYTNLFTFSMLEIYLGNLKDLLVPQPTKQTDPMPPCLTIQTDPKGGIDIENLAAIAVSDYNQALRLYRLGSHFRSTASTDSNMTSSRSHCLIRISITCFNAPERRRQTNKIWLVDLGGSERVQKTRAWGKRLDEGKAINLSLSALGDVIHALQRNKGHIPFRNSKLTQVLKDSLGEDSKTLMLVHVSPKEEDLCETICTLNFVARVRSVRLGNEDPLERAEKETAMQNLQDIMEKTEYECQSVRMEVEKVTEKLKFLTGEDPSSIDDEYVTAEASQFSPDKKTPDLRAAPSSKLPGFMRSTVCSQRKSGPTYQTLEERQLMQGRRRKAPSQRAKSVAFPVKGDPENNSLCSVSRMSCMGNFNLHNADSETVYSQDISDRDIKKVVFSEEEKKAQTSSIAMRGGYKERFQNSMSNKNISEERLKVDTWLKSREPRSAVNGCSKSRKIPQIPLPQKDRINVQNRAALECQWIANHNKKEKNVGEGDSCSSSLSEVESVKSHPQSTDSVITDDGSIYTRESFAASLLLEDEIEHHSEIGYGRLIDNSDRSMDIAGKTPTLEGSQQSNSISVPVSNPFESIHEINDLEDESRFSSKLNMIVDPNIEKESSESWETGRRTGPVNFRRALFMDDENQKDGNICMQFAQSKAQTENRGLYDLLQEKVQIVCGSVLLGLGFRCTGLDHDFFYALTL